jgi:DNA-binding Xre family transcriptional regulator
MSLKCVKVSLSGHIISKYYKNKVVRYDSYVLDRVRAALGCCIADILVYEEKTL